MVPVPCQQRSKRTVRRISLWTVGLTFRSVLALDAPCSGFLHSPCTLVNVRLKEKNTYVKRSQQKLIQHGVKTIELGLNFCLTISRFSMRSAHFPASGNDRSSTKSCPRNKFVHLVHPFRINQRISKYSCSIK